ncbi:Hypothetical predicted protein [Mytilus galloprovincialis]|uniref:Uncharacterized protein n=1 Tax=Mytilus galloprovincialis TaxID=29158 RepID=A0A8B6F3U4_MYTGA|nr:Hypothetical predicted protein [Mytilus galloprovincialis]
MKTKYFLNCRYITGNPIDIIEIHVFDNNNNIRDLQVFCKECFDCDCLSVTTFEWITKMAIESERYEFTCRNGATLPNTVVNCSDDGLRLAVSRIQNESSCNCNEPISMKYSSLDLTTETNPAMESTIDNVQHKTKTKALILSGIAASITLITAFIVLKKFIATTSRIKNSDLTDTEHNNTINDGYNFIKTIFFDGQEIQQHPS